MATTIFILEELDTTISGGASNDHLIVQGHTRSTAVLQGGAGRDHFSISDSGAATVSGGTGDDLLEIYQLLRPLTVTQITGGLRLSSPQIIADIMDDVETIWCNLQTYTYAEVLAQSSNLITGTAGDDTIYGTSGDDMIKALEGNDWILPGGVGTDTVDGGAGWEMVSFSGFGSGITVRLDDTSSDVTTAQGTTDFLSIEAVTGTSHGDDFGGNAADNHFRGLGGADRFNGSAGADYYDGGGGTDTLVYDQPSSASPGVYVSILRGRGWVGEATGDRFTGIENLGSGDGNDTLDGDHGANTLDGGYGDDILTGLGGDNYLKGGNGTDVAVYFGNQADYQILRNGFRTDVTHLNGGWEGHDILAHVDILRFADGDLIL